MSEARDKIRNGLLVEGLGKPVDLNAVDWHVRHRNRSAPQSAGVRERQRWSLRRWRRSLDHSMHKVSHVYVKHYDDPERWMFSAWLALTAEGKQLAECLEQKDIDLCPDRGV